MLRSRAGWLLSLAALGLTGCGSGARLRVAADEATVTFILRPATGFEGVERRAEGNRVVVEVGLTPGPRPARRTTVKHGPLTAAVERVGNGPAQRLKLSLPGDYPAMVAQVGPELRVQVSFNRAQRLEDRLDEQVKLTTLTWCRPDSLRRCYALRVAKDGLRRVKVVTAGETIRKRRTVAEMAAGALAGINGGYFDTGSGAPLGAVKIAGEWITRPLFDRTALLLGRDGSARIAAVAWRGQAAVGGRQLDVQCLNRTPEADAKCAVLTRRWGGVDVFPGFWGQRVGNSQTVVYTTEPADDEPTVQLRSEPDTDGSILGAGPRLVRDGRVEVTKQAERFRPDVADAVTARSGCGLTAEGELILAFGEAKAPYTAGWSLEDWAAAMLELGCQQAMGLDGHTMATMVVDGKVIGRLTADQPQAVATALVVARP